MILYLMTQKVELWSPRKCTLSSLISMQHANLFSGKFSHLHGLIRVYTLIDFRGKFLPSVLKCVGKIIFYLVPTRLLGPTCLLNSKKLSYLHAYLAVMFIRQLRVHEYFIADFHTNSLGTLFQKLYKIPSSSSWNMTFDFLLEQNQFCTLSETE